MIKRKIFIQLISVVVLAMQFLMVNAQDPRNSKYRESGSQRREVEGSGSTTKNNTTQKSATTSAGKLQ